MTHPDDTHMIPGSHRPSGVSDFLNMWPLTEQLQQRAVSPGLGACLCFSHWFDVVWTHLVKCGTWWELVGSLVTVNQIWSNFTVLMKMNWVWSWLIFEAMFYVCITTVLHQREKNHLALSVEWWKDHQAAQTLTWTLIINKHVDLFRATFDPLHETVMCLFTLVSLHHWPQ